MQINVLESVNGLVVMFVVVVTVESNYMAPCFVECSWNTEQGDPLGLLIKVRECVCFCVCVPVCLCVSE